MLPALHGEAERAKRERAMREKKTVKSIQIGNAMTRRVSRARIIAGRVGKITTALPIIGLFCRFSLRSARVIRARVSCRSAVARSVPRIPTETIASRSVRNNTNNRDRVKVLFSPVISPAAPTMSKGGAQSHLPVRVFLPRPFEPAPILRGSHLLRCSHFSTDRRDFLPHRSNILTVILAHCFCKKILLSSSPDFRKEKEARLDGISHRKFETSAERWRQSCSNRIGEHSF